LSDNSSETKNASKQTSNENQKDYEKIIAQKDAEIKKLEIENKKHSDDIAPGIRVDHTFQGVFKNGYADGTVTKEAKKQKLALIAK